jgi:hypothetical protein
VAGWERHVTSSDGLHSICVAVVDLPVGRQRELVSGRSTPAPTVLRCSAASLCPVGTSVSGRSRDRQFPGRRAVKSATKALAGGQRRPMRGSPQQPRVLMIKIAEPVVREIAVSTQRGTFWVPKRPRPISGAGPRKVCRLVNFMGCHVRRGGAARPWAPRSLGSETRSCTGTPRSVERRRHGCTHPVSMRSRCRSSIASPETTDDCPKSAPMPGRPMVVTVSARERINQHRGPPTAGGGCMRGCAGAGRAQRALAPTARGAPARAGYGCSVDECVSCEPAPEPAVPPGQAGEPSMTTL